MAHHLKVILFKYHLSVNSEVLLALGHCKNGACFPLEVGC